MIDRSTSPKAHVVWSRARQIIGSLYPPINLFEDIADPADWPLLIAAEQKTNPRLMETLGAIDTVPKARRVGGPRASYLMAPLSQVSPDRPSRLANGTFGVLYGADRFDTPLAQTTDHHERIMGARKSWPVASLSKLQPAE